MKSISNETDYSFIDRVERQPIENERHKKVRKDKVLMKHLPYINLKFLI